MTKLQIVGGIALIGIFAIFLGVSKLVMSLIPNNGVAAGVTLAGVCILIIAGIIAPKKAE